MSKRLVGGWLASVMVMILALSPAARAADPLKFQPALKAGDALTYALTFRLDVEQQQGATPPIQTTSACMATFKIMVDEVAPDRSVKGRIEFKRVKLTAAEPGGGTIGYEFPGKNPIAEDAPAPEKLGPILGGAKLTFVTDEKGNVTITGGFEDFIEAASKLERSDNRLLGFFTPAQFGALIQPVFTADNAGEAERAPGSAWQTSELIPMPPVGALSATHNWTTGSLDGHEASYSGKTTFEFRRAAAAPESAPAVNLLESEGFVAATFDPVAKVLSLRKASVRLKTEWKAEPISLTQTQTSIVNLAFQR